MAVEIRPNASASAAQSTEVGVTTQARRGEEDSKASTSTISSGKKFFARIKDQEFAKKSWKVLTWTPKRCRWDPEDPPKFGMGLNLLFGFASTFTVANLYYNHPILNILADEFNVSNERASLIPTLMQAGYAAGLLFLCPLGDIFRRRAFVLILVFFTATIWLGLCLTESFPIFLALSFITAASTVTPQLMLPLVGDLAPPHRRATALSIVVSGLLLGMLIARLLSGILTQYTSWRSIYWFSFGMQYLILVLLFFFMPDYPSTNPGGLNYFSMLFSILKMIFKHPVLVQACIVGFCTSSIFTSFWTTLTFLLSEPPYEYSPVSIGLFALVGIGAMCFGPFHSKAVIDRFVPLFSVILGLIYCLAGVIVGTFTGRITVAGPIIQAFAMDIGIQTSQIANRSAIYSIEPRARNRVNTAFMVSVFCGQLAGTAIGNRLYAEGGWKASGGCSIGFIGAGLVFCFVRGPWEKGWVGWRGGWGIRRRDLGGGKMERPAMEQALEEGSEDEKREAVSGSEAEKTDEGRMKVQDNGS
ncbi:putative transporter [Lachnellula hyalina]|uniref:Putative transporter n=1 Tax=Lachnellula hyalina TaxID=1316788 RepID=A0A8H8U1B9_9HELO|nr:putative transporter [Lachnellula hyalina]TVY26876.1 putative transporter [Lachnellula hyalina]